MNGAGRAPGAAIVGAGMMGVWHARAAVAAGARVVMIIDSDAGRASALASEFPGSKVGHDAKALRSSGAAAVHVCTSVDTHFAWVEAAASARIHVLVEKPLAGSAAATAELLAFAESAHVLVCPVHQFLFQRGTLAATAQLEDVGQLLHFDARIFTAGAERSGLDPEDLIAGVLPHPLSLAARFVGEDLSSASWKGLRPRRGELLAISALRGTSLSVLISTAGRPTANALTLTAERGTIRLDLFHGFWTIERGTVSRRQKISAPFSRNARTMAAAAANLAHRAARRETAFPGLRELVQRFYSSVTTGAPAPISNPEILAVAVARDRILAAVAPATVD